MIVSSKKITNNVANIKLQSGPNFVGFTAADKKFAVYDLEFSFNSKIIISGGNFLYALALYENNDIKEFVADKTNVLSKQPKSKFVKILDLSSVITNTSVSRASSLKTGFVKKDITRLVKPSKDYPQSPNSNNFVSLSINKNNDNETQTQINTSVSLSKYLSGYSLPFENIVTQSEFVNGNPKIDGVVFANKNPLDYETKTFSYGPQNSKNNDLLETAIVTFEKDETYKIAKIKIIIPNSLMVSNQLLAIIPAKSYIETGELEFKPIYLTQFNPGEIPDFNSVSSFIQPNININSINKSTKIVNLQITNKNPYSVSVCINKVFYDSNETSGLLNNEEIEILKLDCFESRDILFNFDPKQLEPILFFSFTVGNSVVSTTSKRIKGISNKEGIKNKTKIFAFNSNDNQSVEVEVLLPSYLNSLDVTIKKRVRAINGSIIRDYYQVDDTKITKSADRLVFKDNNIKHDQIYEYISYCLKGNCFVSKSSSVFYRNIVFNSSEVASMQITNSSNNSFFVDIKFSTTKLEQVLTALKESISGEISTDNGNIQIGNFIDNIKTNREKLADLFKVNVVRQDFQTGQESDLGNFSAGEIIISDALLEAKNVERQKGESRYIFRLLQRSATTLFNEIRETITDPETLTVFDANLAKFLNPLSLISNILPSESRLKQFGSNSGSRIMINDQFYEGFTGKVFSLITSNTSGGGSSGNLRLEILDNGKKYQMIKIIGNASRDHLGYLFSVEYFGTKTPIFYAPPAVVNYNFVDTLTSKLSGPRRYVVESIDRDLVKNVLLVSDVVERN